MKNFRVWFTIGWSEEDYLDVRAENAEQAWKNVIKANCDWNNFEVQSVESLD